jgi:hypothetical protein
MFGVALYSLLPVLRHSDRYDRDAGRYDRDAGRYDRDARRCHRDASRYDRDAGADGSCPARPVSGGGSGPNEAGDRIRGLADLLVRVLVAVGDVLCHAVAEMLSRLVIRLWLTVVKSRILLRYVHTWTRFAG